MAGCRRCRGEGENEKDRGRGCRLGGGLDLLPGPALWAGGAPSRTRNSCFLGNTYWVPETSDSSLSNLPGGPLWRVLVSVSLQEVNRCPRGRHRQASLTLDPSPPRQSPARWLLPGGVGECECSWPPTSGAPGPRSPVRAPRMVRGPIGTKGGE